MSTFKRFYKATTGGNENLGNFLPTRSNLTTLIISKITSNNQL